MAVKREWDLTSQQRKVAELYALGNPESGQFYKVTEICEMTKTPRSTFYEWKGHNEEFNDYINFIADQVQANNIVRYYEVLDDIILHGENENAKLKGIELVLKRMGKLRDNGKLEVDINGNKAIGEQSLDDMQREIENMRRELGLDES